MRVTKLFITLNTHIKVIDKDMRRYYSGELLSILDKYFKVLKRHHNEPKENFDKRISKFQGKGYKESLLWEETETPRTGRIEAASIEIGPKHHKIHLHFGIILKHNTKLLLVKDGKSINTHAKEWWDKKLPWQTGCSVNIELGNARAENYALKGGRQVSAIKISRTTSDTVATGAEDRGDEFDTGASRSDEDDTEPDTC